MAKSTVTINPTKTRPPITRNWSLRYVAESEFFAALRGPLDGAEKITRTFKGCYTLTQFFAPDDVEPLAQVVQFHDKSPRVHYYLK